MNAAVAAVTAAGRPAEQAVWSGSWVADRLGVSVRTLDSAVGIELDELVGLAIRRNPRRAHLLVSTVLGKHVPTDPRIVYGAGRLLGLLAADVLAGADTVTVRAREVRVADALRASLPGDQIAAAAFLDAVERLVPVAPETAPGTVVVGYAETATALGHCVASALGVPSLHSTRRPVDGVTPAAGFAEEHSHATDHLLLPEDPRFLADARTVVLVDDEISTGRTALNTIAALQAAQAHARYVVVALIDLRTDEDRARFAQLADELGTRIDVVSLASGAIALPADILDRAERVLADVGETPAGVCADDSPDGSPGVRAPLTAPAHAPDSPRPVAWLPGWGEGVRDGARHGFAPADEAPLAAAAASVASHVDLAGDRVLVLGFEELMYAPLHVALALAGRSGDAAVRYSTTTRSPVLAVDHPGYAIRTTLTFPAHDDPADGPGLRHAHNVAAGMEDARRFTDIVMVVDSPADTAELSTPGGLLDRLAGGCDQVHLVVIPSHIP